MFGNRRGGPGQYGGYGQGGGYGNRGRNFGGYGRPRGGCLGFIFLAVIVISLGLWLRHTGQLGHLKNKFIKDPTQQTATVNQGLDQARQINKNIAGQNLEDIGVEGAADDNITNKTLLNGQFSNLRSMYSFGPVYTMFVFSNSKADIPWLSQIDETRTKGGTVVTLYGKDVPEGDTTFIRYYFTRNFNLPKKSKKYGKEDGKMHPFMVLFVNGKPVDLITNQKDEKALLAKQLKIMKTQDAKANNFEYPDQPIGIKSPHWGKALQEAADYAKEKAESITN